MKTKIINLLWICFISKSTITYSQAVIPIDQPFIIEKVNWNNWATDTKYINTPNLILTPSISTNSVEITGTAGVNFYSSQEVHMSDGFHAGNFLDINGHVGGFVARIKDNPEVVLINNNYTTLGVDGMIHIPKWEKFEVGLKLLPDYTEAINNFFLNYYAGTLDANKHLNPYANDSLKLEIIFTSPTGIELTRYGFFMRMGHWANENPSQTFIGNVLTTKDDILEYDANNVLNDYSIRFRFAPNEESSTPWLFKIKVSAPFTKGINNQTLPSYILDGFKFICDPELTDNKGFLSVNPNNKRYLKFDNGEPFFGLGVNIADSRKFKSETTQTPPLPIITFKYMQKMDHDLRKDAMGELNSSNANWMRTMALKETYEFEYEYLGVYDKFENSSLTCDEGPGNYYCTNTNSNGQSFTNGGPFNVLDHSQRYGNRQAHAWAFDDLLDKAREKNIYLQHCIDYYHVGGDYQNFQWGDQCYYKAFVKPTFNPDLAPYMEPKKYFGANNGPNGGADGSAMYYWKRHYFYLLARYGYSVNIGVFETFNEIDGMLTFNTMPGWSLKDEKKQMCASIKCAPKFDFDIFLTPALNNFLNTVIPLSKTMCAENPRLFSISYMDLYQKNLLTPNLYPSPFNTASSYFQLFQNSNIDIADVHTYSGPQNGGPNIEKDMNLYRYNVAQQIQNNATTDDMNVDKPREFGEGTSFMKEVNVGIDNTLANTVNTSLSTIFDNYESTFHNAIWSSLFMGNYVNTLTWNWEVVHWWPRALDAPKQESIPFNSAINPYPSNMIGEYNTIQPDINYPPINIQNKQIANHFQAVQNFITNSNISFDNAFEFYKIYNENDIQESYYMVNQPDKTHCYGWIHNLNKYWQNDYYYKQSDNAYNACVQLPLPQQHFTVGGLLPNTLYNVEFYPTTTVNPVTPFSINTLLSTLAGELTIYINGVVLGPNDNNADFAFRVLKDGVVARKGVTEQNRQTNDTDLNFTLFPNPNNGKFEIDLNQELAEQTELKVINIAGSTVYQVILPKGSYRKSIELSYLPKGVYQAFLKNSNIISSKRLIVN